MSRQDKLNGFLSGMLLGGVLGTTIAMLFTPVSGKKMRRRISRSTEDVLDDVNDYIESSREKVESLIKDSRKKADAMIQDARRIVA